MLTATWRDFMALAFRPSEVFEAILTRRGLMVSLGLGTLSYYLGMLQISEMLLPRHVGGWGYVLLNVPLSLARLVFLVALLHMVACRFSNRQGRWRDLLAVWGYTQLPYLALTSVTLGLFFTVPRAIWIDEEFLWMVVIGGIALLLAFWGLLLKLQALKICYHLRGSRLAAVVACVVPLYMGYGWLERTFVYERGIIPQEILAAMDPTAPQAVIGWPNLILPFDTATYQLRTPERGEIVAFVPPGQEVHKPWARGYRLRAMARVVGLEGEQVEVQQGQVRLHGQLFNEPYLQGLGPAALDLAPMTVPPGHVFLLGDNRALAVDAYRGGMVPSAAIRGRLTEVGRLKWRLVVRTWLW